MEEVPLKILIVEDSKSDLELIVRELSKGDFLFKHNHCDNEKEFCELLTNFEPDIILSDHNLPSFNSIDALNKAREYNPQIPFILVSGNIGEDEAVEMIVERGANDFILKDNLIRLNHSVLREYNNCGLKNELNEKSELLKRLSLVASHTHNGVVIANSKGRIEWVNKAYTSLTGYTLADCIGQKPGDLLQGKDTDLKTVDRIRENLKNRIPFREEILNYKKDGTPYWVKLDITAIEDSSGQLTNYIGIQEDITEQKEFELKLLQAYERLERAQEIGEIGNWEFDLEKNEINWSEQIFKIYERELDEGNPTYNEVLAYHLHSEDKADKVEEAIVKGISFDVDKKLVTKLGKTKHIRLVGVPIFNKQKISKYTGVVQDITKRINIQNALLQNQKKLENIANNIPGIVYRYKLYSNGKDQIEYISDGVESIFEVSQEDVLNNSSTLWSLILEEDIESVTKSINDSAENMSLWTQVFRIKTKSGKVKWVDAKGIPTEKTTEYIIWDNIVLDKTNEILFEESLKKSNDRLLEAQKLAQIGDWSIDFENNETFISPMVREILGACEEFKFDVETGLTFFKEGYDRNRKKFVMEQAVKMGTPYSEELQVVTPRDETKWVRSIGQAEHKDGKCLRIYGTIMDITTEKEKELILKKNEERLEAAVNGAELGQWDMNNETGEHHVNEQCFKMLGYSSSEVDNGYDFFFSLLHPEDAHIPQQQIQQVEEGALNKLDAVLRLKNSDGHYQRILARGKVVEFDDQGKAKRLVGTHLDVTESVELQENLKKSLHEKTILLAEIHHRVKNNLAIVSGLLELQAMESKHHLLKESLIKMGQRIKSIAGVHELLYNRESFSNIPFKIYVENLIGNINSSLLDYQSVKFELKINKNLDLNINQAVPMGLLLNELATNSFKYAFEEVENPTISFSLKKKKNHYYAFFSDNGKGIDSNHLVNPKSLGMTLIKTLLQQLDAEYQINNKNGFALTFNFKEKKVGAHGNL
ncbi:MAG: PAS domain-containing protein [Balneola sp.]